LTFISTFEQGLTELPEEVKHFNSPIKKDEIMLNLQNIKNILDTFILLANSDKLIKEMSALKLDLIFERVNTLKKEEIET
jgi:hypothetical protein